MAELSKLEGIKGASRHLRGTIAEELKLDTDTFSSENVQLLKFHGTYQQDNRDNRGKDGRDYIFMVRSRVPGGKVSSAQFLKELELCERYGNGTLRITDRQGFQLHGVKKAHLADAIRGINEAKLSTIAACGDVCRNFMCCPAPYKSTPVRTEMQAMADMLANHFRPRTAAYYEIWMRNGETSEKVHEVTQEVEPIYGQTYLPRKFKFGISLPEDNCIDVYAQDLGLLAIHESGHIRGYNVLVGGSMGMTPANKETFPAVAKRLAFVEVDQVLPVCEAIVKVQRDFGNRVDRKLARMKYLIHNWGLDRFRAKVEEYYGKPLAPPDPTDVTDVDDHLGWHEQGDGRLFFGINVENGRIADTEQVQMKSAIRALLARFPVDTRLTAIQSMILCDIEPSQQKEVESILRDHGVPLPGELTLLQRFAIACPALPTCGLAVTESERVMPDLVASLEAELDRQGLLDERIAVHMTGCPNGCGRPYTPDIGIVGKARGKYTIYLGGNAQGTRLAFLFDDMVPFEEITSRLAPVFTKYKCERNEGESFGDYCFRVGRESLIASEATAATPA